MQPSIEGRSLSLPGDDVVDVWTIWIPDAVAYTETFERILSSDEIQKAARFLRTEDRTRYVVAHGFLRKLLGKYLEMEPTALSFITNGFGKPALAQSYARQPLCFNFAHSGDVILCAVTTGRQVGVDVEAIKSSLDVMELARAQFADEVFTGLGSLSSDERQEAFFRVWTRKEAFLKARGDGLQFGLNRFAVSVKPDPAPILSWVDGDPAASKNWSIIDIGIGYGYVAALAVERPPVSVSMRVWTSNFDAVL